MTKTTLTATACVTLLLAGMAVAQPTPQQPKCDYARITAWKTYQACIDSVVAKRYLNPLGFDGFAGFARCRHSYFQKWLSFQQPSRNLTGTTCLGSRFADNGDGTVTDNLTALIWEKKTNLDGTGNSSDPHDADNEYTWSTATPWAENGTIFTDFLMTLNSGTGFAGSNGWRLPTLVELQTTLQDYRCAGVAGGPRCKCASVPCIDPSLQPSQWHAWCATDYVVFAPGNAWFVTFISNGTMDFNGKTVSDSVRAVRGGL